MGDDHHFRGSIVSIFLAQTLLKKFSAKGIVPEHFAGSEYFCLPLAIGAGLTVILATVTGFPISTTHALTGRNHRLRLSRGRSQVNLAVLESGFRFATIAQPGSCDRNCGRSLHSTFTRFVSRPAMTKEWCICVGTEERVVAMPQPSSILALHNVTSTITLSVDEQENCRERYAGSFFGIGSQQIMDAAHFLSAGTVSFARGLNDTPKLSHCCSCGKR